MKKVFTLVICALSLQLSAQHETLFGDLDVIGAFGGPIVEISKIGEDVGADVGGGGALILNNLFLGGYGMGTEYPDYEIVGGENAGQYNIKFGHGGLWFGYVAKQSKLVHFYSSFKLGWGKARLRQDKETIFSDRIFAMTPEIGFEVNLTDFFKLSIGGGYRWVNGVSKLPGLDNDAFSSPVGILTFRFGGFGDDWDWDW
ncbi:MAG: hypothetical protein DHS20C18_40170 [Saprospiraceae bacterium]|nr:MAG: hypothetical protein DHS20C18_40170 [Saprospiraceae bacterium]